MGPLSLSISAGKLFLHLALNRAAPHLGRGLFSNYERVTRSRQILEVLGYFPPDSPSKHVILFKNMEEEVVTICFV